MKTNPDARSETNDLINSTLPKSQNVCRYVESMNDVLKKITKPIKKENMIHLTQAMIQLIQIMITTVAQDLKMKSTKLNEEKGVLSKEK